uniref:BTB domain-containing protein n=1 Tax=Anopheles dirus TaxID=7168 RepID=A0A182NG95_9DIPT
MSATAGLSQQFCVRWNSHLGSLGAAFPQLLAGQRFVDVTLACEGHQVHCHRLVLAACSTYFENLLGENPCQHPIIILPRDIKLWAIQALVDFMYKGEVNVSQAGLPDLMKCAEILKIRGLCGSDAALNLNQIHSPPTHATGSGSYQQQQHHNASSDTIDGGDNTKPSDAPFSARHGGGQYQTQHDLNTRSHQNNTSSGPKRQLLNSLNLQPIDTGSHQQNDDGGNQSDNGESGNEMCIKTEDLMIDEDDTGSRQCADDEELPMDGSDKNSSDAIRCEQQFLGVDCNNAEDRVMSVRLARDALQDRMEEEAEVVEEGEKMIDEGSVTMERSDESQSHSDHQDFVQDDYAHFANENEGDDEDDVIDNDVMEVREETEDTAREATREGVPGRKEMRKQVRKISTNHHLRGADAHNELMPPSTVSIQQSRSAHLQPNVCTSATQQQQRANGARSIGAVPSLSSISTVRSSPGGSRGSIRVKSIENLFENYHAKQSPKSSRDDKRKLGTCGGANNSENDSASEHVSGVASSLLYNRSELDIYVKQQQHQHQRSLKTTERQSSSSTADAVGGVETNASMGSSDGDGYENIICSPNFPQLTGVVGGYKAEEDDEDEEYGDDYAIQLLAEEIDSSVLANGGESDGDEILYKPPPLMAGGANTKPSVMRTYGRVAGGMVGNGATGATSTLTIRKIERQGRGNMGVSQSTSLTRPNRRPRLTGRSKDALNQLLNANGAPPPIAFTLRNPRGNQPRTYNTEALWAALMDVKAGESIYRASQMHKVPRKTLRNWMKRWDIKSAYPMPRQLKEAAEKKRIIKELTSQIQ